MEENSKSNVTFNIYGGNNQILPNATEAVQNFYGGKHPTPILAVWTISATFAPC